jgi:hypothetical protein
MRRAWQLLFAATAITATLSPRIAYAQAPVSLQEQLNAQYKTVKIGPDGEIAGDPGTLLAIQKNGIIAAPWNSVTLCPAKFQDHVLHLSTGICAGMMQSVPGSGHFKQGTKVYAGKVEVNLGKGKITFLIVGCKACYHSDQPFPHKAEVVFEFPKGYLEKASASEVEDTIGQVFTVTTNDDQQAQGDENADQQQPADQQTSAPPQAAQSPQQAEPQTVQLGMTTDQVQAALGKPEKIFNVGAKQIYTYKDVKITFLDGKVSDVQ